MLAPESASRLEDPRKSPPVVLADAVLVHSLHPLGQKLARL
jgi:hypothetical protein